MVIGNIMNNLVTDIFSNKQIKLISEIKNALLMINNNLLQLNNSFIKILNYYENSTI